MILPLIFKCFIYFPLLALNIVFVFLFNSILSNPSINYLIFSGHSQGRSRAESPPSKAPPPFKKESLSTPTKRVSFMSEEEVAANKGPRVNFEEETAAKGPRANFEEGEEKGGQEGEGDQEFRGNRLSQEREDPNVS